MPSGDSLLVGSTSLGQMYRFLRDYKAATLDLDKLLQEASAASSAHAARSTRRCNRPCATTPNDSACAQQRHHDRRRGELERGGRPRPTAQEPSSSSTVPTTRTIWEVCRRRLEAGGTGQDPQLDEWKQRVENDYGAVVTRIIRVRAPSEKTCCSGRR